MGDVLIPPPYYPALVSIFPKRTVEERRKFRVIKASDQVCILDLKNSLMPSIGRCILVDLLCMNEGRRKLPSCSSYCNGRGGAARLQFGLDTDAASSDHLIQQLTLHHLRTDVQPTSLQPPKEAKPKPVTERWALVHPIGLRHNIC
jgi:hypothetical protein